MFDKNKIIGFDFQGWPEFKMTLREVLMELGFEEIANEGFKYLRIRSDNPILDIFPRRLKDDGMGYGAEEEYITEAYADQENNSINIFTEAIDPKLEEKLKENGIE